MPVLSQAAEELDLEWTRDDPVSLAFRVQGANWSGSYSAPIKAVQKESASTLATLTVTAIWVPIDPIDGKAYTDFTLSLANSTPVQVNAFWELQVTGGVTRLEGRVLLKSSV